MPRRGRKMNLRMPRHTEAHVMNWFGIKLTDEPPLPGYVIVQYTRHSNRPNCRCNRLGKLHGPYYYRKWCTISYAPNDPGMLRPIRTWHKDYVPLANIRSVMARCRQHRIDQARWVMPRVFWRLWHGKHPLAYVSPRTLRRKWIC